MFSDNKNKIKKKKYIMNKIITKHYFRIYFIYTFMPYVAWPTDRRTTYELDVHV